MYHQTIDPFRLFANLPSWLVLPAAAVAAGLFIVNRLAKTVEASAHAAKASAEATEAWLTVIEHGRRVFPEEDANSSCVERLPPL